MTQNSDGSSNERCSNFESFTWAGIQTCQHFTDEFAVMPFFIFDSFDSRAFFRITYRLPMTAVGKTGCALALVSQLKDVD